MPLFEFACRRCGHQFEFLAIGNRAPECVECGSTDLEKRISSFGARTSGGDAGRTRAASPRFT